MPRTAGAGVLVSTAIVATAMAISPRPTAASPSPTAARPYEALVDLQSGEATVTSQIACTPGDDVEIDLYLSQRESLGFTEIFFTCPPSGSFLGAAETSIQEGSDPLRPGMSELYVVRRDYVATSDFNDVVTTTDRRQVPLTPRRADTT